MNSPGLSFGVVSLDKHGVNGWNTGCRGCFGRAVFAESAITRKRTTKTSKERGDDDDDDDEMMIFFLRARLS